LFALNKIISTKQTKEADAFTIDKQNISSIELMEKASLAFVKAIESELKKKQRIAVVCGTGNNGGDGFAIARILKSKGYGVDAFLINISDKLSQDCEENYKKLKDVLIVEDNTQIDFSNYDIILDAIFGAGLSREIIGIAAKIIVEINKATATVFSVDIPSGLYCDKISNSQTIVKADVTITFQRPKKSFFFLESQHYLREWKVVNINLDDHFIQNQKSQHFVLDKKIAKLVKKREKYSHKGTYGHSLIIAGSYGKIGAAVLSSKGCLKAGSGLVTVNSPKCGYQILQSTIPEAMCLVDKNEEYISQLVAISPFNAIGIGPGIGKNRKTKEVLKTLLSTYKKPIVIDADALNILSENQEMLELIPKNSILTPHPKEFERLVGKWKTTPERQQKQLDFASKYNCIIVLKDANTCISDSNGNLFFNTSGNPGMATGGSGDVLTGIITGLLAQQYQPLQAALIGVYFHGKAGYKAAKKKGQLALSASDIVDCLRIEN
jgi:hydroxyethylthiazole kinase-like uncharacterized protein yjeF